MYTTSKSQERAAAIPSTLSPREDVMQGRASALAIILLLSVALFAQSQTQNDAVTLTGTVGKITRLSSGNLHVWLESASGRGSEVCLGSSRFLEDQGFLPSVGDSIQVTAARTGGASLLVADSLQMRGKTLTLANARVPANCAGCGGYGCAGHDCGGQNCGHHNGGHHNCGDHTCSRQCGSSAYYEDHE